LKGGMVMKALNSIDRKTLAVLGIGLAAILFAAINVFSSTLLDPARLDLTEDGLFTVSDGTADVIATIDEPIILRFYYSRDLGIVSPGHGTFATRVRELLEHYADLSDGMLRLSVIDPEPFSVEEDEAVAGGLRGITLSQAGDLAYFGLLANNSTDDKEVVPFFDPRREPYLEYDLTKLIFNLAQPKKKVVALLSGLPLEADPLNNNRPWAIIEQMKQFFEVRPIGGKKTVIDDDVDVLMLVHPRELADETRYAVDQFVLGGGKALVFVDPLSEEAAATAMAMRRPPGPADSRIEKLFDAWGVAFGIDMIVGDMDAALKVRAPSGDGRTVVVDYLAWMNLDARHMSRDDVVTDRLENVNVATTGFLTAKEGTGTELTPLISTGPRSMRIVTEAVRLRPDPVSLYRKFKSEDKSYVLAARVRGPVKSAFPEGPPADAGEASEHLTESKGPVNLVIVADTDMLSDRLWLEAQDFLGQRMLSKTADNGDFVINILDNLMGSDGLIGLRSRGLSARPFHRIMAIQRTAEMRYLRSKQELSDKLTSARQKLIDLEKKAGNKGGEILTKEQKKTVREFRSEMVTIRQQLRNVQHALRKDIEALGTWLTVLNIWAMPALVSVVALVMAIVHRRRYRRRIATA
jgi:ABC-type uncharacterized transport system involved in gliding motility auxiliary subunit